MIAPSSSAFTPGTEANLSLSFRNSLKEFLRTHIRGHRFHIEQAARALDLPVRSLQRELQVLDLGQQNRKLGQTLALTTSLDASVFILCSDVTDLLSELLQAGPAAYDVTDLVSKLFQAGSAAP